MNNNVKIAIVGHFGDNKVFTDGQTIKTKTIYEALKEKNIIVTKIDTFFLKKNPFIFLGQLLKGIISNKKIIILLSLNGRKYLFPIFYILQKYFKKEIYHYAIGGRLMNEVSTHKNYKKYVESFSGNWLESTLLTKQLQKIGIKNAVYVPNFKRLKPLAKKEIEDNFVLKNNFCVFSRITKKKGIIDAIDAIVKVNKLNKYEKVILDIYGPVEEEFKIEFEEAIRKSNGYCNYKGIIPAEESVEVLKKYLCLLFPTHWYHEGIPGTIVDAFMSGVPVIARCWRYCNEMIDDRKTGLIYSFDSPEKLFDSILYALDNKQEIYKMKFNCLEEAKKYSEDEVLKIIFREMRIEIN